MPNKKAIWISSIVGAVLVITAVVLSIALTRKKPVPPAPPKPPPPAPKPYQTKYECVDYTCTPCDSTSKLCPFNSLSDC